MKWSLIKAAREWSRDEETVKRRLVDAGFTIRRGATFHTRDISAALVGDLEREKILETRARRVSLDRENVIAAEGFISMEEVQSLYRGAFGAVRAALLTMASSCASACNPADPGLPHAVIQRFIDERVFGDIRAGLPHADRVPAAIPLPAAESQPQPPRITKPKRARRVRRAVKPKRTKLKGQRANNRPPPRQK
jgi:hypothetical protein